MDDAIGARAIGNRVPGALLSHDVFHRPQVGESIAAMVLEASPTSGYASGLLLAAPRRTGKSTFLREDLRPLLEEKGALVLYADLWEDRQADPGDVAMSRSAVHTTMESDADAATNTCARPKATGASGSCCQQRMPTAATRLPTRCISQWANKSPGPAELR